MKTYEGMFLLDAGQPSFDEAVQPIQAVLERNKAEVIHLKKWDERRLAYEIRGRRRGLYVLTYFKADPLSITSIERDVQLNESILRVLILSADHVSAETMAAPTPAETEPHRREGAEETGEQGGEAAEEGHGPRRGRPRAEEADQSENAADVDVQDKSDGSDETQE
ncbi:MAG: 30S ribosomal protein S6 [Planctomycetes bacterium]|nr:30S ribosomal protein S6 [Planctomycetota bacterium]